MGEAVNLVNNFKVEKVIFNCGEFNDLEQELIKVLEKKNINYYSCMKELYVDNYKLQFLNTGTYNNENDNSSVIYLNYNNYKFLFMADAGIEVEKDLIKKYNLQDIDILKVGHHGSKTSSCKNFIDEINPKYSIISVGKNNRYGHPNNNVLNNLEDSKIYRTDLDGSIEIKLNKNVSTIGKELEMEDKYYKNIKEYLISNEVFKKVKDYSKNKNDLITYYNVGKELSEAGKHYGEGIIKKYSKKLKEDLNKVYSYRSLNYMVRYYEFQKMQSVTANLSWDIG